MTKSVIGIDMAANPGISIVQVHEGQKIFIPARRGGVSYNAFAQELLEEVARTMGVSYEMMRADYAGMEARRTRLERAAALLDRAAEAMVDGRHGWGRKMKRARRIQLQSGDTSFSWFRGRWNTAVERRRRQSIYLNLHKLGMGWIEDLLAEVLVPGDWKKPGEPR